MEAHSDRHDGGESTTTTIPMSDSAVGIRVSEATLVADGADTRAVKIAICAGGAQGSVTMDIERARAVCDALEEAVAEQASEVD